MRALLAGLALGLAILGAAPVASSQPTLSSDSARVLISRTLSAGWLSDSTARTMASCVESGVPMRRSYLVGEIRREICSRPNARCMGFGGMYLIDTTQVPPPRVAWVDSLQLAGLVTVADLALIEPVLQAWDESPMARWLRERPLDWTHQALRLRESLDPRWIAADSKVWVAEGLMTEASRRRLLSDLARGRVGSRVQLLRYVDAFTALPLTSSHRFGGTALPADTLTLLLDIGVDRMRAAGVEGLTVDDVRLDSVDVFVATPFELETPRGVTARMPLLSARVDGRRYHTDARDGERAVLTLLNQVLRDRANVRRVATAKILDSEEVWSGQVRYRPAWAVLTRYQLDVLNTERLGDASTPRHELYTDLRTLGRPTEACRSMWFRAYELLSADDLASAPELASRERALTSESLDRAFDQLAAAGLFDGYSADELARARTVASSRWLRDVGDVLEAMPGLLISVPFDPLPVYDGERPHALLLEALASASRGSFAPTDIEDPFSFGADSLTVSFREAGRTFAARLRASVDYYDYSLFDLVVAAMEGRDGMFYRLGRDFEDGVAFLTPEQRRVLVKLGLWPDGSVRLSELVRRWRSSE